MAWNQWQASFIPQSQSLPQYAQPGTFDYLAQVMPGPSARFQSQLPSSTPLTGLADGSPTPWSSNFDEDDDDDSDSNADAQADGDEDADEASETQDDAKGKGKKSNNKLPDAEWRAHELEKLVAMVLELKR
jgi:hypothetical protein